MKRKHSLVGWLLALTLCVTALLPQRTAAADLYFTSINDNLLPLSSSTMPLWYGGTLYVPYTVFDARYTGMEIGISSSYSKNYNSVTFYSSYLNRAKMLVFDMSTGTCYNEYTKEGLNGHAILKNGFPYVPIGTVCRFFGLDYTYNAIPTVDQGYLVRIKDPSAVLSDARFMDAAANLFNKRLKEYNQSIVPSAPPEPEKKPESAPPPKPVGSVSTYLGVLCRDQDGLPIILDTLDRYGVKAMFFLDAATLTHRQPLVHRMLGSGHSIGLLAEGKTWSESREQLAQSQALLSQLAFTRATAVYVPQNQREAAREAGWIPWSTTLMLTPSSSARSSTFAANTMDRLKGRTRSTYLTLTDSTDTARVIASLLRSLEEDRFEVELPLETRL